MLLSISPLRLLVSAWYIEVLLCSIHMYNCYIFFLLIPSSLCPVLLCLLKQPYFKVYFTWYKNSSPSFFWYPFAWNTFLHITFSLYVSLHVKWVSLDSLCLLTQFSCVQLFVTHGLEDARLPCPSQTPRAYSNSYPSSWWCHPTISSSVIPFSSSLQPFPESGSF